MPKTSDEYRQTMYWPMENLAIALESCGFKHEGLDDSELVEIATRKMKTLFEMILATGMSRGLLEAVMKE